MTFREWAEDYCYQRGMFPDQAKAVVDALVIEQGVPMESRWTDHVEGYPEQILVLLSIALDACAIKWIDENLPRAWYRPMFLRAPQTEEAV